MNLTILVVTILDVFIIYHNRYRRCQAAFPRLYKLSGADKNIGTVLELSKYLLIGESCTSINWGQVACAEYAILAKKLFGDAANEDAKKELKMVRAYFMRDYTDITPGVKNYKKLGSFPIGKFLKRIICLYIGSYYFEVDQSDC
jgi:hypothetical protein